MGKPDTCMSLTDALRLSVLAAVAATWVLLSCRGVTGHAVPAWLEANFLGERMELWGALELPPWAAPLRRAAVAADSSMAALQAECPGVQALPLGSSGATALWLRYAGQRTPALNSLAADAQELLQDGVDTPDTAIVQVPPGQSGMPLTLRGHRGGLFLYLLALSPAPGASATAVDPSGAKAAPTTVSLEAAGADLYALNTFNVTVSTAEQGVTLLVTTRRKPLQSVGADLLNRMLLGGEWLRDKTLAPAVQASAPAWGCLWDSAHGGQRPVTGLFHTYAPDVAGTAMA